MLSLMAYLGIHTATSQTSLTLLKDGQCFTETCQRRSVDTDNLIVAIDKLCKKGAMDFRQLSGIAVTTGPGHYLGIRVGVTTASMLREALQKPVFGISTLEALLPTASEGIYLSLLPARKGTWHACLLRVLWQPAAGLEISESSAMLGAGWVYSALTKPFLIAETALGKTLSRFHAPITVCGEIPLAGFSIDEALLEQKKLRVRYVPTQVDTTRLARLAQARVEAGDVGGVLVPYYGYEAV
jgi:tRNA threonylcarbamoyl adenosine modification protein YeaZ